MTRAVFGHDLCHVGQTAGRFMQDWRGLLRRGPCSATPHNPLLRSTPLSSLVGRVGRRSGGGEPLGRGSEADVDPAVDEERGPDGDDAIGRLADLVRCVKEVLDAQK